MITKTFNHLAVCGFSLCVLTLTACSGDDSLADSAMDETSETFTSTGDGDSEPTCGDGIVNGLEDCDPADPDTGPACTDECEWDCRGNPVIAITNVDVESLGCSKQNNVIACVTDDTSYDARVTWTMQNDMISVQPILLWISFENIQAQGNFDPGYPGGQIDCEQDLMQLNLFECSVTYHDYPLVGLATGDIWMQAINICMSNGNMFQPITWMPIPG